MADGSEQRKKNDMQGDAIQSSGAIHGKNSKVSCRKEPGYLEGPLVPTKLAAKEIYVAIARSLDPSGWRKHSEVFVLDEGNYWGVGQHDPVKKPSKAVKDENGVDADQITISSGGGAIEMQINKCNASVRTSYSR